MLRPMLVILKIMPAVEKRIRPRPATPRLNSGATFTPAMEESTEKAIDMARPAMHKNISQRQVLRSGALIMHFHLPPIMMPNEIVPMTERMPSPP